MATLNINNSTVGASLRALLIAGDIEPGSEPSYQLCKAIYTYHPLGKKLADTPIILAQSQPREIAVAKAPDRVREQFVKQWMLDGCDGHIANLGSISRIYGIGAAALLAKKTEDGMQIPTTEALDYDKLGEYEISYSILDPLNTAGSLVGDLNPNSMNFLKTTNIAVSGQPYHRSRSIILMNEKPIYLDYTGSAFGYVGRSVYQRALYPLKSFIKTMVADEMVATKCGVIVAKMKAAGSIVTNVMQSMFGLKRDLVKESETWNVISITPEEEIGAIDLTNVNASLETSRRNIITNIATAADMPAIIINSETYAEGFGEGTEDANNVARYIQGVRDSLQHIYEWFDDITRHRAWNRDFFLTMQEEFPEEYGGRKYEDVLLEWTNSFTSKWPSLIQEPDSEKIKVADAKMKAMIAVLEVLLPEVDQENRVNLIRWLQRNFNELEDLFDSPLDLDFEALEAYEPPAPEALKEPGEPKPFAAADADSDHAIVKLRRRRRG